MDICTVRKSDGFMTMYSPAELRKMANKLTREHGSKGAKLETFWVCSDAQTNETRLIAQYKEISGWSSSIGMVI